MAEINCNEIPSPQVEESPSEIALSAAEIVEKIVEEVVAIIADGGSNPDPTSASNSDMVEIIQLMLNGGPGPVVECEKGNRAPSPESEPVLDEPCQKTDAEGDGPVASSTPMPETETSANATFPSTTDGNAKLGDDVTNSLVFMQIIVNENKGLRKRVGQLESLIRFVMSKYRNSVTFLLNELDRCKEAYPKIVSMMHLTGQTDHGNVDLMERDVKIFEMEEVMRTAALRDDHVIAHFEELTKKLSVENKGLRELVDAAYKIGVGHFVESNDQLTQTDPVAWMLSEDEDGYHLSDETASFYSAENNSSPSASSTSSEKEDGGSDCESVLSVKVKSQQEKEKNSGKIETNVVGAVAEECDATE